MKDRTRFSNEDDKNGDNNGNNSDNSLFMYMRTEQPNGQIQGDNRSQIKTRAKP
jgi:hypothetical protein